MQGRADQANQVLVYDLNGIDIVCHPGESPKTAARLWRGALDAQKSPAFKKLEPIRSHVTRTASELMAFIDTWGKRFVAKEIRRVREELKAEGRIDSVDFATLTRDEAFVLGFRPSG